MTEPQDIETLKKAFDAKYGQGEADKLFKANEAWDALQLEMSKPKPTVPSLKDGPVYAFWHYDQFPYLLSGQVYGYDEREGETRVLVKGYGGYTFRPRKLITGERGEAFHHLRAKLGDDYRQAKVDLLEDFEARLQGLCDEFGFTKEELPHWFKSSKKEGAQ